MLNVSQWMRLGLIPFWAVANYATAAGLLEVAPHVPEVLLYEAHRLDGSSLSAGVELTWYNDTTSSTPIAKPYGFEVCFHEWGYFAEMLREEEELLHDYRFPWKSVCMRSNSYSLDIEIDERTMPGAPRSPSDNDAFIWEEQQPSFVPIPLLPSAFRMFLLSLSSVKVVHTNDSRVGGCILLRGDAELGGMSETWELLLAREHGMFPIETKVYMGNQLLGSSSSEFSANAAGAYYPSSFHMVTYQNGQRVFSHEYRGIRLVQADSGCPKEDRISIPPTTLVNDFRFGDGIAYYMADAPPTQAQLQEMATNEHAIEQYQRLAFVPSPARAVSVVSGERRAVVLIILVILTLSGGLVLFRCRRKQAR